MSSFWNTWLLWSLGVEHTWLIGHIPHHIQVGVALSWWGARGKFLERIYTLLPDGALLCDWHSLSFLWGSILPVTLMSSYEGTLYSLVTILLVRSCLDGIAHIYFQIDKIVLFIHGLYFFLTHSRQASHYISHTLTIGLIVL